MNKRKRFFELLHRLINSDQMKKDMEETDRVIEEDRKLNHMPSEKRNRILQGDDILNKLHERRSK